MKYYIIGTAGHVDHGKTTLIKALTGVDTDRLPEEKTRGLSIDLGFAHLQLTRDISAGIVDVPGHHKFLKNMLAGVGGYDLGLLVVDAQESVMPQTIEHVEILELLQTKTGLTALTKIDMVDSDFLEIAEEDLRAFLKTTFLSDKPLVKVSAVSGEGIDTLKEAMKNLLATIPPRETQLPFRLPIDRVFIRPGFGTVITGSLWSGTLHIGDQVEILPLSITTKIRGLQVHGRPVELAVAGQRVAVNLSGVEPGSLRRGHVLSPPGLMRPTRYLNVNLEISPRINRPLKNRTPIRFYASTQECLGRLYLLSSLREASGGSECLAHLVLDTPAVVRINDRFILRDFSAQYTLGGGTILELAYEKLSRKDASTIARLQNRKQGGPLEAILTALSQAPGGTRSLKELARELQLPPDQVESHLKSLLEQGEITRFGKAYALTEEVNLLKGKFMELLEKLQASTPHRSGWPRKDLLKIVNHNRPEVARQTLSYLIEQGVLKEQNSLVSTVNHTPVLDERQKRLAQKILTLLTERGFTPPSWKEIPQILQISPDLWEQVSTYLLETGKVIKIKDDIYFDHNTIDQGKRLLRPYLDTHGGITPSEARKILNSTRKYTIPLLEHYDSIHFTQRIGDRRVPGSNYHKT